MVKNPSSITVRYQKSVLEPFRRAARAAFPNEILAFLLGHEHAGVWEVLDVWFPPVDDPGGNRWSIDGDAYGRWEVEVLEHAREEGLEVIGDIHTHPYEYKDWCRQAMPSEGDWAVGWPQRLSAICQVQQERGGRLTTRVRFYPPCPRVIHDVRLNRKYTRINKLMTA